MKAIITVIGKDRVGIIHDVSKILLEKNINILDISQTILNGCFTMMMVVEFTDENSDLSIVKESLDELAKKTADKIVNRYHNQEEFDKLKEIASNYLDKLMMQAE